MLERAVEFRDGARKSTGRIDLYKRGCFILSTTRYFQSFPNASLAQQARIRELTEQLDAHRKRQQAQHLTFTDLYNVVEKLRAGQPLAAKNQQTNQQGLASGVLSLHQQLDATVAEAYGWPPDLPEAELLQRLVRLNHERAREEQTRLVRYLRPAYQAPEQQQAALPLPAAEAKARAMKAPNAANRPSPSLPKERRSGG